MKRGAWASAVVVVVCGVVAVVCGVVVGCDLRPTLAQIGLFDGYRPELVEQCCACLAARGTGHPEASCSEGELLDGGIVLEAGAVVGTAWALDDAGFKGNDDNDVVDEGEIPCLCRGSARTCRDVLNAGDGITVPGACLDQVERTAPCETACAGIINFDPVPVR